MRAAQVMPRARFTEPDMHEVLRKQLARYAAALSGSHHDAEDLVQQAIAKVLAAAPDKLYHVGYIRSALTRLWLDERESLMRRARAMARLALTRPVIESSGSDEESREAAGAVRSAMDRLPPRQRAVLAMRLIEGLSYEQIAADLGCDAGAVRATLHLARSRVREWTGGEP